VTHVMISHEPTREVCEEHVISLTEHVIPFLRPYNLANTLPVPYSLYIVRSMHTRLQILR